jgi:chromosome partitioning protein
MKQKVFSLINHKGGVGKTTTTHNLGKALSLKGKKVLMIDNDPQANLTTACGIEVTVESIYTSLVNGTALPIISIAENLDLVPTELDYTRIEHQLLTEMNGYFKLKKALKPIVKDYDIILIDCPPSLGALTSNALIASDALLIVVQSSYLSVKGLQTIVDIVNETKEELNPKLEIKGFILTQENRTVVRKEMIKVVKEAYPSDVFETIIRQSVALEEATTSQTDIFTYAPDSTGAADYMSLAEEFLK